MFVHILSLALCVQGKVDWPTTPIGACAPSCSDVESDECRECCQNFDHEEDWKCWTEEAADCCTEWGAHCFWVRSEHNNHHGCKDCFDLTPYFFPAVPPSTEVPPSTVGRACSDMDGIATKCEQKGCSYNTDDDTCSNNYPDCITEYKRPSGRKLGEWFSSNVDDCSSGCLANEECEIWKYDAKKETCQLVTSWPEGPPAFLKKGSKKVQTGTGYCNNETAKPLD